MYKGNSSSHSSGRSSSHGSNSSPSRGPSRGGFSHIAGRSSGFKGGAPRPSGFAARSGAPSHAGHGGFHARPSTSRGGFKSGFRSGGFKGGSRGGGGRGGGFSEYMNPAKFINKVAITETVETFKPEHAFSDFAIDDRLKQSIIKKGYTVPTPIQDRTIPHILKGSDLVGVANTGTGKTAAFLIPLIHKVLLQPKEQIMIIVPTRELALQIDAEFKGFSFGMKMFSVCCVGGMSIGRQISSLKYHNSFIIGTPGRLKDLINRKMIKPANFRTIVLDEADRMLDMGFVADMRMIMALMPKDRQTLFFSATISQDIEKLIGEFLREPVRISVKTGETAKNVEQDVVRTAGKNKIEVLHDLLNQKEFSKVLIFGRTKHGVEKLSKSLIDKGFKTESIHGNKNHVKRQQALRLFKEGNVQILVATDVAARGLDIADITHVINYELPATYDDYVHRIGRTGRGNKKGKALTFIA